MDIKQLHMKALQFNPAWADVLIARNEDSNAQCSGDPVQSVPVAAEVITDCFLWSETPEGVDFWCAVAVYLWTNSPAVLCSEYPTVQDALVAFESRQKL